MCLSTKTPAAAPAPPPAPAPVAPESKAAKTEIAKASDQESKRARLAQGRKSTILTGPLGVQGEANVFRKTLLGQ